MQMTASKEFEHIKSGFKSLISYLSAKPMSNETATRGRVVIILVAFLIVFLVLTARLISLGLDSKTTVRGGNPHAHLLVKRQPIVDRNGAILAQDERVESLYIEPKKLVSKEDTYDSLMNTLPELPPKRTSRMINSSREFAWIKRELTQEQREKVHLLGLPAVGFKTETKRQYPSGALLSHIIGRVDVDHKGISGIESHLDSFGFNALANAGFASEDEIFKPLELSIDVRAQQAVRRNLLEAVEKFQAKAGYAVVLKAKTAEIISLVSLPDYEPDDISKINDERYSNRSVTGVFEMGSTFKTFTMAMALESGQVTMDSKFDARHPIAYAGFKIKDFHAQKRVMSVPEIFQYSSNIGTALIARKVGVDQHQAFLKSIGLMDRLKTELAESAQPIVPKNWTELSTMTISYGHGIAVSPLQTAAAAAAVVNGGYYIKPTFLKRGEGEALNTAKRVVSEETSKHVRDLLRLNAVKGSGRKANIPGLLVGGKTGTAEKIINGRYVGDKLLTSFLAAFPMDNPEYVVFTVLDEPKGTEETSGYATAGWNVAPTTGAIIQDIAPILDVIPRAE